MNTSSPGQPENSDRAKRFIELFGKHEHRVKCYILALMPNWADAEDVFAETNARVWEQFDEYDPEKSFAAWACTIAHYQVLSRRRELARDRKLLSTAFLEAVAEELPNHLEDQDRRFDALRHCMRKLSGAQRALVDQIYGSPIPLKEVAAQRNETPTAVSMKLMRIRGKLRDCIELQLRREEK